MRLIKIGLASVNPTVGAVKSNASRVIALARQMGAEDTSVACFSEQVLGGYPAEDLVQWPHFVAAQRNELLRIAQETRDLGTVIVVGLTCAVGSQLFNTAAVVHRGKILGLVPKEKLPTYNVFYERRTLSRGAPGLALDADGLPLGDFLFEFDFGVMGVEVCEDGWSPDGPMRRRCYSGAELIVNVSASPYRMGVVATRREMLATRSADNQVLLAYANTVGGQDGLVFDGGGYVFQNGRLVAEAPRLQEGYITCVADLGRTRHLRTEHTTWRTDAEAFHAAGITVPRLGSSEPTCSSAQLPYPARPGESFFIPAASDGTGNPRHEALDDLIEVLALGVRDYFQKTGTFRSLGIAVSGGRDSVLTLLIAWRAVQLLQGLPAGATLGKDAAPLLTAFYMPTGYSESGTRVAAETICLELGVTLHTLPLGEAVERELGATRAMLEGAEPTAITKQNIQARLRALRMWNWSNSAGALFLQTGDMSEKAVGYTTVGGDLEGGLSVIANVPKTVVVMLLERLRDRFGFEGITATLATEPGPELAAAQRAEQELMPFEVLDACLHLYVSEKMSIAEVAAALPAICPEHDPEQLKAWATRFARLFTASIYKWVQAPLALHVGGLDLDRERALQLPVVQRSEWS